MACDLNPYDLTHAGASWCASLHDEWKAGVLPDGRPLLLQPSLLVRGMRTYDRALAICQNLLNRRPFDGG